MGQTSSSIEEESQLTDLKRIAIHSGYIYKQSRWLQEWNKRFYMLIYNEELGRKELLFCHDDNSLPTMTVRIGSLQGYGALTELSIDKHPYGISICQAGVPLFLSASSEEERKEFISVIKGVLSEGTREVEKGNSSDLLCERGMDDVVSQEATES